MRGAVVKGLGWTSFGNDFRQRPVGLDLRADRVRGRGIRITHDVVRKSSVRTAGCPEVSPYRLLMGARGGIVSRIAGCQMEDARHGRLYNDLFFAGRHPRGGNKEFITLFYSDACDKYQSTVSSSPWSRVMAGS